MLRCGLFLSIVTYLFGSAMSLFFPRDIDHLLQSNDFKGFSQSIASLAGTRKFLKRGGEGQMSQGLSKKVKFLVFPATFPHPPSLETRIFIQHRVIEFEIFSCALWSCHVATLFYEKSKSRFFSREDSTPIYVWVRLSVIRKNLKFSEGKDVADDFLPNTDTFSIFAGDPFGPPRQRI